MWDTSIDREDDSPYALQLDLADIAQLTEAWIPCGLELDQHPGGARLVDAVVGEADVRRAVGAAVGLLG